MRFDVVIIGGGLAGMTAGVELLKAGKSCVAVSEGLSLNEPPTSEFMRLGGTLLLGDSVVRGSFEGSTLLYVQTAKLGATKLEAQNFILATGKFFSKGLISDRDSIREPVFGCDVCYDRDRNNWTAPDFFAPQPFEEFGVETDANGRVSVGGMTIDNLYAAGEILKGRVDIVESALEVCRRIR